MGNHSHTSFTLLSFKIQPILTSHSHSFHHRSSSVSLFVSFLCKFHHNGNSHSPFPHYPSLLLLLHSHSMRRRYRWRSQFPRRTRSWWNHLTPPPSRRWRQSRRRLLRLRRFRNLPTSRIRWKRRCHFKRYKLHWRSQQKPIRDKIWFRLHEPVLYQTELYRTGFYKKKSIFCENSFLIQTVSINLVWFSLDNPFAHPYNDDGGWRYNDDVDDGRWLCSKICNY